MLLLTAGADLGLGFALAVALGFGVALGLAVGLGLGLDFATVAVFVPELPAVFPPPQAATKTMAATATSQRKSNLATMFSPSTVVRRRLDFRGGGTLHRLPSRVVRGFPAGNG
ncbi:MAG TPA: hypothetical protein VMU49_00010 [Candidatus Acidoferrales bacterium]|nr:hypothetical protein [Candidatus Acidoferrales bacterium]